MKKIIVFLFLVASVALALFPAGISAAEQELNLVPFSLVSTNASQLGEYNFSRLDNGKTSNDLVFLPFRLSPSDSAANPFTEFGTVAYILADFGTECSVSSYTLYNYTEEGSDFIPSEWKILTSADGKTYTVSEHVKNNTQGVYTGRVSASCRYLAIAYVKAQSADSKNKYPDDVRLCELSITGHHTGGFSAGDNIALYSYPSSSAPESRNDFHIGRINDGELNYLAALRYTADNSGKNDKNNPFYEKFGVMGYVMYELPGTFSINSYELCGNASASGGTAETAAYEWKLLVSSDGKDFTEIEHVTKNTQNVYKSTFPATDARYVVLGYISPSDPSANATEPYTVRLYEFSVFLADGGAASPDPVLQTGVAASSGDMNPSDTSAGRSASRTVSALVAAIIAMIAVSAVVAVVAVINRKRK